MRSKLFSEITLDSSLATKKLSVGVPSILMASSAPIARAFRRVGSLVFSPKLTTVTLPPCCSLSFIALVSPNSS